jgi:tetratricopeptide (TPR) repeat protein
MRDSVVKKLASSELQRQWRAKNLIGELSIFYDDDNMRERLDEIWEGLLKTRGGGVVTILATEDYFYQTWCLAELMAAKLLYECPDEKERIRLCFIAVGMTVNEVKENWFMKEHAPDLVTGNNAIRVYEIPLPQVSGRAEMDSAVNNLVNSIAETVVELGSKSLAVGKGQEASFHVMKEVVHRSFLGSTEYNSLLPIMAHDMHVIFQHLKDFLANKGASNAKDALNAYARKWLSDWSRRDWAMRKNELVDCLKQAEALPKPSLKVSMKCKYNDANLTTRDQPPNSLLPESPILYGREDEMEKLGEALNTGGRMAALVGGAGMGKSHCASDFVHKWLQQDVTHRFVLWIESDTENIIRVSYFNGLDKLLGGHGLDPKKEIAVRDIAALLWEKLREVSTQFEWMVVYNNVPEALGDLAGPEAFSPLFFPTPLQDWGRGRILLTTRCTSYGGRVKSLGNHHVSKISVEPIDETTAVTMLTNDLDDASVIDSERDAAKETVKLFGYLPLAIVTANSQMVDATLTVSEYLEDMKAGLEGRGVHDAVSLALANALAYAHKQDLGRALEVAAFLSPDNLTLELLGCDRRTARRLCELSLLRHVGNDVYTIHRLHQEAARNGLSPLKAPLKAIGVVNNALKRFIANNSDTWKFGISMIPHLESLEKNVDTMVKNASINLENDGYREYAWIFHSYANILHCVLQNYEEARSHYEQSLEMKRHVYGPETKNTDLASTLGNLGILESDIGSYDKARVYYEQSLEMKQHVYGPEAKNTDLTTTLNNLGELERVLHNYDKARLYYEQSLEMERHVYGPEAKNTFLAKTLGNLGSLDMELGNYDKARLYYEQSLEMNQHVYGPEAKNTDLASTLRNLGELEMELGNYDKARVYYEQSLEMQRNVYGPEAKNTNLATILHTLGIVEMELGNYNTARLYYEQSLEMKQHVYDPETKNTDLAATLHNLGILERMLGNYNKARVY